MKHQLRTIIFAMLLIIISVSLQANAEEAPKKQSSASNDISQKCSITASNNPKAIKNLTDNSIKTVWKGAKGTSLFINVSEDIGSIYIIWDKAPMSWTLTSQESNDGRSLFDGGKNGFLNEFVPITNSVHSLTISFNNEAGTIADIYIFGKGDVPDWVQKWQPMLDKADMLVYIAHADDEFLWFGGALPVYAGEYHKKVQVAYLIHHGAARNEYFRNHELLDGLWKAGITNYPMISQFEDKYTTDLNRAIKMYNENSVLNYTVMLFRRFKPDIVVTHDTNGEYGHGVHKLCAFATQKSIPLSNDPNSFPESEKEYGTWGIKKCYIHLYSENAIIMDWNVPLSAFNGKTGIDMAKLCFQCHKSQTKKNKFYVESEGSKYDCRKFGLYYSTVGPDINKNDFFENISPIMPTHTNTTKNVSTNNRTTFNTSSENKFTDLDQTTVDSLSNVNNVVTNITNDSNTITNITEINKQVIQNTSRIVLQIVIITGIILILCSATIALFLNRRYHNKRY